MVSIRAYSFLPCSESPVNSPAATEYPVKGKLQAKHLTNHFLCKDNQICLFIWSSECKFS